MGKRNITEDMTEYRKDYRLKNPEKFITEKRCEICGGKYQVCSKHQHFKTKIHKTGVKMKELEEELEELKKK